MIYKGNHKLGDFFTSRRERGMPGLPMLSVTMNNGVVTRESLDRKMESNLSNEEHLLVRKDDIVYNMMRMWQGASGLADRDGLISPAYVVLAPKKGIDPLYASYLFKSSRLIYLLWAYSYGLTSDRLRLYFNDFQRIPVNIPSLAEQRKIGKMFATWDKSIEILEALIAANNKHKKALMQQLLSGKKRFMGFDEKWKLIRLDKIIVDFIVPMRDKPNLLDGPIPWCRIEDFIGKYLYSSKSNQGVTEGTIKSMNLKVFPANTLLVSCSADLGKCAIVSKPLITNQTFIGLVPDENKINVDFLYYLISLSAHELNVLSSGTTISYLSRKEFERFTIKIPENIQEQKKIAQVLTAADREIETLQQKLAYLKQEKKALMQQLLTGKRRVKVDES